jgi:hypothetical protein
MYWGMWGLISRPSSSSSAGARPALRASSNCSVSSQGVRVCVYVCATRETLQKKAQTKILTWIHNVLQRTRYLPPWTDVVRRLSPWRVLEMCSLQH